MLTAAGPLSCSQWSTCVCRLNDSQPIQLGNIVCLNNFLGGLDEEWFRLVHVEIEAKAAPALGSIQPAQVTSIKQCLIATFMLPSIPF